MKAFRMTIPARAAALALLALAAARSGSAQSKCTGPFPGFPDAALSKQSVIFSNAFYEASMNVNGTLRVMLLYEGRRVGDPFSVYHADFYGTSKTGGYRVREDPDYSLKAGTPMPVRQPKTPVKFEVIADSKDRQFVEIAFGERTITVDMRYKPWSSSGVVRVPAELSVPESVSSKVLRDSPEFVKLMEQAGDIVIAMQPESGEPVSLRFNEEAARREYPKFREFTVHGKWNGYVVRGRTLSKGAAFHYYQYRGTTPAEGFHMSYSRTRDDTTAKVEFEFEPVERKPEPPPPEPAEKRVRPPRKAK